MDIEAHIQTMRDELDAVVVEEIRSRYRRGIAALSLIEIPEARQLWKSREFLGIDSVRMALERIVYDEAKGDFVDGLAVGSTLGGHDPLDQGFFWNSKLLDQVYDTAWEFGPAPCKTPMLTTGEKSTLSAELHGEDVARFVFGAMKHIALARSDRKSELRLANEWYFRAFDEAPGFVEESAEVLKQQLYGLGYQIEVVPVRNGFFSKKPMLRGGFDVVIRWEKRRF